MNKKEELLERVKNAVKEYSKEAFQEEAFFPGKIIQPSGKKFDEEELIKGVEAILDGWWTEGRFTDQFTKELASFFERRYALAVNSGSSANLLAVTALTSHLIPEDKRIFPGDEIITAAAGFPTTINPIIQNNAIPVFVDSELGNYNANIDQIEEAITNKTKAIFLAHTLGNPFDAKRVAEICEDHNITLIEDTCDALGAEIYGKKAGTFGRMATLSMYPAHHITAGEGGAVITDDPILKKALESIRDWGRDCWCSPGKDNTCRKRFGWKLGGLPEGYDHKYIYSHIGYNLKWTDMQAAIASAQLKKAKEFIKQRRENFSRLHKGIRDLEGFFILPSHHPEAKPSWFGFALTIKEDAGFNRRELISFLDEKGVGTRLLFAGNITKQPYFKNIKHKKANELPVSDMIMRNTFWIGVHPGIRKEQIDYMISTLSDFTGNTLNK